MCDVLQLLLHYYMSAYLVKVEELVPELRSEHGTRVFGSHDDPRELPRARNP